MKKYQFSKSEKFKFYLSYIFYRIVLPFEVKVGRISLLITEIIWASSKVLRFDPFLPSKLSKDFYVTKFGEFYINPDLISTIAVSPSFERTEINMLLKFIGNDLKSEKSVLFIDVGAFFGLYTVIVGNKFKKNKKITILSFEPDTNYLSEPTFKLLKKNIEINKIKNAKLYHFGLGENNSLNPNKVGVKTKKLDTVLSDKFIEKFDSIYMKIDVDGFEKGVIIGSERFIKDAKQLTLLVEDFVDHKIINYLKKDFEFVSKPSAYNSFWSKK